MSYEDNVYHLTDTAEKRYVNGYRPDKLDFTFYNKHFGSSRNSIVDTQAILEYIVDKKAFIKAIVEEEINRDGEYIASGVSGIPDIKATRTEKIGFTLLELDEMNRRIDELAKDKKSLLTKEKTIKNIIKNGIDVDKMRMINITVESNNTSLTFKYPATQLYNLNMSSWYVSDLKNREKYEEMFKDYRLRDEDIIAKIVKIVYGKKVLYEGDVIATI